MGGIQIPKDVLEAMREQLAMLQEAVNRQGKQLQQQAEQLQRKDERIGELEQMLLNMQRARFGQQSEKRKYVLDDGAEQLSMFGEEEADNKAQEKTGRESPGDNGEIAVSAHTRKPKRTLEELCRNLPVEERIIDLPEEEKVNANGKPLVCIGVEPMRTEIEVERTRAKVVKYSRKVYKDEDYSQEYGDTPIIAPTMPVPLLPHSYLSRSLATDVLIRKYVDGLPLYRQEQIWKRQGLCLKRGTMANWVIQLSSRYFRRLWKRMKEKLLKQGVIHADETVIQVLKEEGRSPTSDSYMWVYASSKRSDIQIRICEYRNSRSGDCAVEFLGDFHGILISDGFSGYNKLGDIIRAGCWAHMQRKWREAMPKGEIGKKSVAAQGYKFCNRLFALERKLEGLDDAERQAQRQEKALPIIEEYYAWIETITHPTGKLKDAVTYALNQKEYLCAFLDHGEIEISNNQVENAIRPVVMGRKGWLFSDTTDGAEATAIVYSLMETAKANNLRLEDYIQHLLTVLPDRFAVEPNSDIDDLLPYADAMRHLFATGD
jgi:Transposase and inactivated derivatives